MEELFPEVMTEFYSRYGYKKGGGPGGHDFTGKIIRAMTKPDKLADLSMMLGEDGDLWIDYLRAIHEAHSMMVQDELDSGYKYEEKIFEFQRTFEALHQSHGLNETLKVTTTFLVMNLELIFSFLAPVRSLVILQPNLCSLSLTNWWEDSTISSVVCLRVVPVRAKYSRTWQFMMCTLKSYSWSGTGSTGLAAR